MYKDKEDCVFTKAIDTLEGGVWYKRDCDGKIIESSKVENYCSNCGRKVILDNKNAK